MKYCMLPGNSSSSSLLEYSQCRHGKLQFALEVHIDAVGNAHTVDMSNFLDRIEESQNEVQTVLSAFLCQNSIFPENSLSNLQARKNKVYGYVCVANEQPRVQLGNAGCLQLD